MHVSKEGAGGAHAPPDFGRSEGAAGSGGAPHYYVPPQIFRLWTMPGHSYSVNHIYSHNELMGEESKILDFNFNGL